MNKNIKQALISILIGACVAFLSTLFQSLAEFLKDHALALTSGISTTFYHILKTYKA